MSATAPASATTIAAASLALARTQPARARRKATEALGCARADGDRAAMSMAERALGVAAREQHELKVAVVHLRRAVRIAESSGLLTDAARARVDLSAALALRGSSALAFREADRAAAVLRGRDLALLQAQRAFLLLIMGRLADALQAYRQALPALRRLGDRFQEATALHNRGLIHIHLGELPTGEADLTRAEQLYSRLGRDRDAADARLNLGCVAARRGDLPTALTWFDRADDYFRSQGLVDAMGLRDRCEALLPARLVAEARQAAELAVAQLSREGRAPFLAEARLMLSEAALLEEDAATARTAAEQAARSFARQHRPDFAAQARYAALRAAWLGGERSPTLLRRARRAADALAAGGWAVPALDARLLAAHLAIDLKRMNVARNELARATRARRRGPVALRSRAWHAQALLRLADGNRPGAEAALRAGMRVLDRYRATLGATELRALASAHTADLAQLGIRLALESGQPSRVLAWVERWRAGCLQLRPARPPADPVLNAYLTELRLIASELTEAPPAGRTSTRLLARQAALEEAVRRQVRHLPGAGLYRSEPPPALSALRATLGRRILVELVEQDGELHAVVIGARRLSLHQLGSLDDVTAQLAHLRFALRRLAFGLGTRASLAAARDSVEAAAACLDDLLLAPLGIGPSDRRLVVVPTGVLHALPWSLLPSCWGRPVTVAPSAALWHRAATATRQPSEWDHVVLVAGPGLPGAAAEVVDLGGRYPDARCFTARDGRVDPVAAALDGADLAHIAAHGRFRADNPLFSSLKLADGPLTVYDLEALGQAPRCLVLSACDSGLSEVRPGDELMGLAAAVLALGTGALVASVTPVPDHAARLLMVALHEALAAGQPPAVALATAQRAQPANDAAMVAGASFVCFGAG